MSTEWTIENEIEWAWTLLTRDADAKPHACAYPVRHYFLTDSGKLVYGEKAERASAKLVEVGYYTPAITLEHFREDVFHAHNVGQPVKKARTLGR